MERLTRIPARCPKEWNQCGRHMAIIAFHRAAERRSLQHGRFRFMHRLCRINGCTAAKAVRLAADATPRYAEITRWSSFSDRSESRQCSSDCAYHIIEKLPACCGGLAARRRDVSQPEPARPDITFRDDGLERSLCPAFVVDQRAFALRKICTGQNDIGFGGGFCFYMIKGNNGC